MLTCAACRELIPNDSAFCEHCGARVDGAWNEPMTRLVTAASPEPAIPVEEETLIPPDASDVAPAPDLEPTRGEGDLGELEIAPGSGLDAVTGEAAPNTTYLGQRLLYEKPPEGSFDPLAGPRFIVEMIKHMFIFGLLWLLGTILLLGVVAYTIQSGQAFRILWEIWGAVVGIVFWVKPIPVLLSEWKFSVDGQGKLAPVVLEHVAWALRRRQTPLARIRVRRLKLPRQSRDYLELRSGIFAGFVSTFAYGQDLYIGWTFWLYLSPIRFAGMYLVRGFQTLRFRGSELYLTLRYDTAKAMREAMHGAAREGVDVAAGAVTPRGGGTIGSDIPVEDFVIAGGQSGPSAAG